MLYSIVNMQLCHDDADLDALARGLGGEGNALEQGLAGAGVRSDAGQLRVGLPPRRRQWSSPRNRFRSNDVLLHQIGREQRL